MQIKSNPRRFYAVWLVFFLLFVLIISRLFFIQFFRSNFLASIARLQHNLYVELEPKRGTIFDRNLRPQTINIPCDSLYANPHQLKDKQRTVNLLSELLKAEENFLNERLTRDKSFVWLARKLSPETTGRIKKLKIEGIGFLKENRRSYPNGSLASHLIGFAGLDNVGLEGLELYYDNYLRGKAGWAYVLRDAKQNTLAWEKFSPPVDGFDLVLSIDEIIQFIAERELDKAYKTFHAKAASIIVIDPRTGEILALANRPAFDLNDSSKISLETRRNRAITDMFEPGSVFKIVTASAALEESRFVETDRFFCENGTYRVANHILHDHQPHGWLTFREVFEESSNIGVTKIAQALGNDHIYRYAKLFGFGSLLGLDLGGEIPGTLNEPRFWSKTSIGAIPIGQEVGVTVLQLACAISVIANDGVLMKPFVLKRIQDKFGEVIKEFKPSIIRQVISPETAQRIKEILVGVVENGTGQSAKIKERKVAGKTGTGQKLEPDGSYSHSKFMGSFIGFAPADDPKIAIAVVLDEPHPYYFGGTVAAPVFKKVAEDTLRYLETSTKKENLAKLEASR